MTFNAAIERSWATAISVLAPLPGGTRPSSGTPCDNPAMWKKRFPSVLVASLILVPGYKLGELQIRRHRRDAEEKLGAKFNQRQFHDAILAIGSVPLPVLEQRMAQFIADAGAAPRRVLDEPGATRER
jgi:hypothetical protein